MLSCSRRELLATFLGIPALAALPGCSARTAPHLPPGELVGTSVSLGHRLRSASLPHVAQQDWQSARVVIVGGGIAGLSAARRLRRAGLDDFLVLELESEPGGTSRSGTTPIVAHPWGAHYVPAPTRENEALCELLREVGALQGEDEQGDPLVAEQYRCRAPDERVFYKGYWQAGLYLRAGASDEDLRQLDRFQREIQRWVAWRDAKGRRAFTIPMAQASDDAELRELDRTSMAEWLTAHRFDSPRLWWFVDYACRDDYGMRCESTSAWAGLFYFAARMPRAGAPSRPFVTWPEGNGRLVRHLAEPLGRKLHSGWAVCDIQAGQAGQADGLRRWEIRALAADTRAARQYRAEQVIFAAPHFLAPYVIRPLREESRDLGRSAASRRRDTAAFEYSAWAVANLTLTSPPQGRGFPLAWDNVLYESPSLGYVATSYQRGLDHGPAVLTWYYPLCDGSPSDARQRLLQLGRDEWAEIALSDLERAHPDIRRQTRRIDVMRWGHAMIRPGTGFLWGGARERAATGLPGLHFAHSDLSGLGLFEEAFYRGTYAAEQALGELGYQSRSIL